MSNQAAWIVGAKAKPFQVGEAPLHQAGPGEVVIRNRAIAVNPVEWKIQDFDFIINRFPNILGCDVAGEVDQVGSGVTNVKRGDRVIGHATGLFSNNPAHGAYQLYTVCSAHLVAKLPTSVSSIEGSVLPIALSTASLALFKKEALGLPLPSSNPSNTGKSILVWGGSSSVGATAIQLGAAAGIKVITVASKHNLEKVEALGADVALDYNSPTVVDDIVAAAKDTEFAGVFDAIGVPPDTPVPWTPVYKALGGRFGTVQPFPTGLPEGAQGTDVNAASVAGPEKTIGEPVWKWAQEALANGKLKAKPDPIVFGKGLEKLQDAVDRQKQGVSFGKIVVEV